MFAHIFSDGLNASTLSELRGLLRAAGFQEVVRFEAGQLGRSKDGIEDFLVVLMAPDCVASPNLEEAVRYAVAGGWSVLAVWPEGAGHPQLPDILERLGGGAVAWSPEAIRKKLAGEQPEWQEPSGEPREEPRTRRNKC